MGMVLINFIPKGHIDLKAKMKAQNSHLILSARKIDKNMIRSISSSRLKQRKN